MSTRLKGPEGATHVQINGTDYNIEDDGLFCVGNGDHVDTMRRMGFLTEDEACVVCASLRARWPRVVHGMVMSGMNLHNVTTAEAVLDIIESTLPMTPEQEEAEAGTIVTPATEIDDAVYDMLLGSSTLPSLVDVGLEEPVQLGVVVARSHQDSGLSVKEWNALSEEDIESHLAATVEAMKAENSQEQTEEPTDVEQAEGDESKDEAGDAGEGAPAPSDDDPLAEVPRDDAGNPTFNKMNRSEIHAWLVAHGGTELTPTSAKDDLITEAETRADALTKRD